jgi:FkbM family methyltransferase
MIRRKIYKLIYKLGLKKAYQKIDRLRYLNRLLRGGKNPLDEWDYSDRDLSQYGDGEVLICSEFRGLRMFFYCDRRMKVEREIIGGGLYGSYILSYMEMLVRPGSIVLDVGANIGAYAIPLARAFPGIEVHAFEPNPSAVARFRRNLLLNEAKNLVLHETAVGARHGRTAFHAFTGEHLGLSSFVPPPTAGSETIMVEVTPLDELYGTFGGRISLLKIDVQGFEGEVLEGARNLIQKHRPYVLLEHEDHLFPRAAMAEEAKKKLEAFFAENGYDVFYLTLKDPFMLFPVQWHRPLSGNLLALPGIGQGR